LLTTDNKVAPKVVKIPDETEATRRPTAELSRMIVGRESLAPSRISRTGATRPGGGRVPERYIFC